MLKLDRQQLLNYIETSQVLHGTTERPVLMLTSTNEIVKFFYRRKKISTATFLPQATRFTANSRKLLALDIPAPVVKDIMYCKEVPVHMVVYDRIEGKDVRELCQSDGVANLARLPAHFVHLHKTGIFFRAVHLGNILVNADKIFLLDISDLSTQRSSLSVFQRARNLAHLFNTESDKAFFITYGPHKFVQEYLAACQFPTICTWLFLKRLHFALDDDMLRALLNQQE